MSDAADELDRTRIYRMTIDFIPMDGCEPPSINLLDTILLGTDAWGWDRCSRSGVRVDTQGNFLHKVKVETVSQQ